MNVRSMPVTRRAALSGGVLVGGLGLAGLPARGAHAAPALARVKPRRADAVLSRFGVCIHSNYASTVYGDHDQVTQWLDRLGVRHVRTRLVRTPGVLDKFEDLRNNHGIQVLGVCGAFGDDESMTSIMQTVKSRFRDPAAIFSGFEGINEPNNDGVPWIDETRRKAAALFAARRDAGLGGVPILAPSLAEVARGGVQGSNTYEQAGQLGDLSSFVNFGNMHVYPRGMPPSSAISHFRSAAQRVTGSRPLICTEGGYFNALEFQGGAHPVSEQVSAAYAPQQILTHMMAGTRRFYRYELLDEPNPSSTDREGTLGMVRTGSTWSAKPDFEAVRRLLGTMADPGPAFDTAPLDMALANQPTALRHLVFARRDGSHVLAMWQDRVLWDTATRRLVVPSLTEPLAYVDLQLGSPRRVRVQSLTTLNQSRVEASTRQVRIGLNAGVTLVELS